MLVALKARFLKEEWGQYKPSARWGKESDEEVAQKMPEYSVPFLSHSPILRQAFRKPNPLRQKAGYEERNTSGGGPA